MAQGTLIHISYLMILAFVSFLLAGCPLLDDDDAAADNTEHSTPPLALTNPELTLTILDMSGAPISGAEVTSQAFTVISQQYNANGALQVTFESSDQAGLFRVSKAGYLDNLVYQEQLISNATDTVTLQARGTPVMIDAEADGHYPGDDGASVTVSANSLIRPDGSTATGDIELYIHPVDISDELAREAFPGSFYGLATGDADPAALFSFGVVNIDFVQNGEYLQLRDGESAQIVMPLYAELHADGSDIEVGDSIPLWILNETTGIWEEESLGVVVATPLSPSGLGLQATTSHFSAFNADIWGGQLSDPNGSGIGPQNGSPGVNSLAASAWCRVSLAVIGMDDATKFRIRFTQLLSRGPVNSRARDGIYYNDTPIRFSLLQNRTAQVWLYDTVKQRAIESYFICRADSQSIEMSFYDEPTFLVWKAEAKPNFDIVSPGNGYEIVSNTVTLGRSFAGDSDDTAEVSSNLGQSWNIANNTSVSIETFAGDPSPATFATYLANDTISVDQLDSVDYIDSQAPTIESVKLNFDQDGPLLQWRVRGADTLSVYFSDQLNSPNPAVVVSDVLADLGELSMAAYFGGNINGFFELQFSNRYGSSSEYISIYCVADPFSDLPCLQPPQ
jgi:hypothetical protein